MDPIVSTPASPSPAPLANSTDTDVQSVAHLGSLDQIVAAAKADPSQAHALYDGLVSANRYSDARSLAEAAPGADGGQSFWSRSWNEMGAAIQHPGQAAVGAAKGLVNTASGLGALMLRGSTYQAAGESGQASAWQSLFGQVDAARNSILTANALRAAAPQMQLPTLPFNTPAEAGGDKIATVAMAAADGAGLVKAVGSAAVKTGVEVAVRDTIKDMAASGVKDVDAGVKSVWELGPATRGQVIEKALGHNLPSNFPTIDRFSKGVATSIKSLDLGAASYQDTTALSRTLTGYVDKAAGFQGATWAGVRIKAEDITARALELATPKGATAAQKTALDQAAAYGASKGVNVKIVQIP